MRRADAADQAVGRQLRPRPAGLVLHAVGRPRACSSSSMAMVRLKTRPLPLSQRQRDGRLLGQLCRSARPHRLRPGTSPAARRRPAASRSGRSSRRGRWPARTRTMFGLDAVHGLVVVLQRDVVDVAALSAIEPRTRGAVDGDARAQRRARLRASRRRDGRVRSGSAVAPGEAGAAAGFGVPGCWRVCWQRASGPALPALLFSWGMPKNTFQPMSTTIDSAMARKKFLLSCHGSAGLRGEGCRSRANGSAADSGRGTRARPARRCARPAMPSAISSTKAVERRRQRPRRATIT